MLFHWRQHKVYQHSSHFRRCYPLCPNCRLLGLYKSGCLQYHPNVLIYIFWHVFSNLVVSSSIKGIINHLFAKTKYLPTYYLWVSFLLVEFITWKSHTIVFLGEFPKHDIIVFLFFWELSFSAISVVFYPNPVATWSFTWVQGLPSLLRSRPPFFVTRDDALV